MSYFYTIYKNEYQIIYLFQSSFFYNWEKTMFFFIYLEQIWLLEISRF